MNPTRRNFFKQFALRNAVKLVSDVQNAYCQGASEAAYFESYTTSYPLVSEYAGFIKEEVEALGIDTSDMSDEEIAQAVYAQRH
ncbi:MAG: hypothetical protein V2I56_19065 [Desulfobacteraceae bacterium]|jgi:hypothetical protein|nr:hypothetical protein [Desulfobacteraceae bacterium]